MNFKEDMNHLIKSGMFGLIVADALGVPYEFNDRQWCDINPMTDMIGYGTYNQAPGTWSDDSSLTIATMDAMAKYSKINIEALDLEDGKYFIDDFAGTINYHSILSFYSKWYHDGYYSPYNECFDIGNTTRYAISNFVLGMEPLKCGGRGERSNGNGSLMRILPAAFYIYFLSLKFDFTIDDEMKTIHNLSKLTHRHKISQMACGIYVRIAIEILKYKFKDIVENEYSGEDLALEDRDLLFVLVKRGVKSAEDYYSNISSFEHYMDKFDRVYSLSIIDAPRDEVKSGGFVLNSLEASLWCLFNNDSYKDTALAAVNLGRDTDTTAAIVGGLAGLFYEYEQIPANWLDQIAKYDFIEEIIDNFTEFLSKNIE